MLPIPKSSRWNGVVYLHGLLPESEDESALHRLVLTSGDFGLAYLTERWASRFVSELFRNYVVCFVGYSINDPVLRYMMDALAADRMLGEDTPKAYALGECELGQEAEKIDEWEAKGVIPILYEVPKNGRDHSKLHTTLAAWADTYRDGIYGKERIVADYALARPSASTQQDDFVGRMLWAVSHESGLPAKRFAEFNPVPPIEWLKAFAEDRYQHADLYRFNVPPRAEVDDDLRFSLMRRPAPYGRAPPMSLVSAGVAFTQWDNVMSHLARWLMRHLNDPVLIFWLAKQGGQLHAPWSRLIEQELDRFALFEREGRTAELDEIRTHSPSAIPSAQMQVLWRLLLTGRVKSPWFGSDLYRWENRLVRDGLTATVRLELRELLSPKVKLKEPFRWDNEDEAAEAPAQLENPVTWELALATDHVSSSLRGLADARWCAGLPALLGDFQLLLRDALDLLNELGEADEHVDRSHWDMPSVSPHRQNHGFRDWVALIELLRDAWLATLGSDRPRARRIALAWFEMPYPTFKRLALFAASQDGGVGPEQWSEWLVSDKGWWLWADDTKRETSRLLVLQGASLLPAARARLEAAILIGPPPHKYRDDIEPERLQRFVDYATWLRLAKLRMGGGQLGAAAAQRLDELLTANPGLQLATNESDEFSTWMSGTGDPDFEASRDIEIAPRKRNEIVAWLQRAAPIGRPFYEDTWGETCRTRFFHSFLALSDLSQEGVWPAERWREALQAWGDEGTLGRSWRFAAPLVVSMPSSVLLEIVDGVTWWMDKASNLIGRNEAIMFQLCARVMALPLEPRTGIFQNGQPISRPVSEAINHPIGHVTQALLNIWLARKPADNDSIPPVIEPFLTQLCDVEVAKFRHGRVWLASRLISLFRVDRAWTKAHLLPCFDWARGPVEANAVWAGFLWSPRLYPALFIAFKSQFLSTARYYNDLTEHSSQFAAILTHAALEIVAGYSPEEYQTAVGALPQQGLNEVAQALLQVLESAGSQREEYWKNRVQPFWQNVWPKSLKLASNGIAESLARLCIAAGQEFPNALAVVFHWLRPIEHPDYVVHLLHDSGLCGQFPDASLRLLNAILKDQPSVPSELKQCLDAIAQAMPGLRQDSRFQSLAGCARRGS